MKYYPHTMESIYTTLKKQLRIVYPRQRQNKNYYLMNPVYLRILVLASVLSLACTTKVSEWVLLNALPEQYTLVYFHGSTSDDSVRQPALAGDNLKNANIQLKSVVKKDIAKPYFALYYENRLLTNYSNQSELKGLTTSPLREVIASEIMAGKLCVLLYLKTGNKAKDDNGMQIIRHAIAGSPFKDIISVAELNRNSIEEAHFVSMLLNVEEDLKTIGEPMLFGIFGRFKALEPLLGKGISEENIKLMIDFLTADCSCVIKDDLPGTDILFSGTWEKPSTALVNRILDENPELQHH